MRASNEDSVSVETGFIVDEFKWEMVGDVEVVDSENAVADVAKLELGVEEFEGTVIKTEELRASDEDSVSAEMDFEVDEFIWAMVGNVEVVGSGTVVSDVVGMKLFVEEFVGAVINNEELWASIEYSVVKGVDVVEFGWGMVGVVELDDGIVDSETFVAEVVGMELRVEEFVGSVIKIEELRAPLEDLVCVDMGVVVDEFA